MSREKLYIIKIGGNVIDEEKHLKEFLEEFCQIKAQKILVHGGGKIATEIGHQLGISPHYYQGRRITDDQTIELVTMVYGGLINKKVVSILNALKHSAIGLTGSDGNLLRAHRRPVTNGIDYGWVGDIDEVNTSLLTSLLKQGHIPVVAPLTMDKEGHLLNTNADTIASEIASALSTEYDTLLIYCFEKIGVLKDVESDDSVISEITPKSFESLKVEGVIHSGMLPKISNSLSAIERGVNQVTIGHSRMVKSLTEPTFKKCTRIKR